MSTSRTNQEKLYDIVKKPIITEKSYKAMQDGQYTFEVNMDATKVEIAQAIEMAFPGRKVKKVRTVYMPSHAKEWDTNSAELILQKKQSLQSKAIQLKNL